MNAETNAENAVEAEMTTHLARQRFNKSIPEIGNRLYKIRHLVGFGENQKKFAEAIGFEQKSYNQWETGRICIPVRAAVAICKWTQESVTLEYIYRGRPSDLPVKWALALRDVPDRPPAKHRRAEKRSATSQVQS